MSSTLARCSPPLPSECSAASLKVPFKKRRATLARQASQLEQQLQQTARHGAIETHHAHPPGLKSDAKALTNFVSSLCKQYGGDYVTLVDLTSRGRVSPDDERGTASRPPRTDRARLKAIHSTLSQGHGVIASEREREANYHPGDVSHSVHSERFARFFYENPARRERERERERGAYRERERAREHARWRKHTRTALFRKRDLRTRARAVLEIYTSRPLFLRPPEPRSRRRCAGGARHCDTSSSDPKRPRFQRAS